MAGSQYQCGPFDVDFAAAPASPTLADLGKSLPFRVSQAHMPCDLLMEDPGRRQQVLMAQQEFFVRRSGDLR
jgi:hypothetical protein